MIDPSLDLQEVIINTLKADPDVAVLVGQRIYDAVPGDAIFPYISYGTDVAISDDADCSRTYEVTVAIDVWSQAVGKPQMKRIVGAVRRALRGIEVQMADHRLLDLDHEVTRYLRDPDGITSHGAMEFVALVQEST